MKELSIFIDESGDFGEVKERPAYIAPNNMKREESALDSCETIRNDEELFHTALEITFAIGYASVSVIQRILHLGYSQTAQIIDEMEKQGIVAPFNDDCPRRLLITKEQWEQKQLLK